MQPSTLAPRARKPNAAWILVTAIAGIAGAIAAIQAGGSGTYRIGPFDVEMRARVAAYGKTELAIRPVEQLVPSHAEAGTHRAPLVFRFTIVGVSPQALVSSDRRALGTPYRMDKYITEEGKSAVRAFALKLAGLATAGAAAAGTVIGFTRRRRIPGAILCGVLALGATGFMVQRTYDAREFLKTRFVVENTSGGNSPGGSLLPSGLPAP